MVRAAAGHARRVLRGAGHAGLERRAARRSARGRNWPAYPHCRTRGFELQWWRESLARADSGRRCSRPAPFWVFGCRLCSPGCAQRCAEAPRARRRSGCQPARRGSSARACSRRCCCTRTGRRSSSRSCTPSRGTRRRGGSRSRQAGRRARRPVPATAPSPPPPPRSMHQCAPGRVRSCRDEPSLRTAGSSSRDTGRGNSREGGGGRSEAGPRQERFRVAEKVGPAHGALRALTARGAAQTDRIVHHSLAVSVLVAPPPPY
jgi:hypothetical protein